MIDIIGMIAAAAHWCASCASDANTLPSGLGIAGGAAAAAGGMGALAPLSDLYPPGAATNSNGDLTWQNPDGTTSTKGPYGTTTTSPSGGPSTVSYPDGLTDPNEEMKKLLGEIPPVQQVGGPQTFGDLITALGAVEGATSSHSLLDVAADEAAKEAAKEHLQEMFENATKQAEEAEAAAEEARANAAAGGVMGQTGYAFGDDGTITTIHPDGSSTTPNSDGSATTTQPDGTSSTTPATMTPRSGVFTSSDTGAGSSGDGS